MSQQKRKGRKRTISVDEETFMFFIRVKSSMEIQSGEKKTYDQVIMELIDCYKEKLYKLNPLLYNLVTSPIPKREEQP